MGFQKNNCETRGNALDVYIATHGPGEVFLNNTDAACAEKAIGVSEFLKIISSSKPKFESVFDGFDVYNRDTGGRLFVKSDRDCAGVFLDSKEEFANAQKFLQNIDAFAIAAENNPDGVGVMLTVDWRLEDVKF